MLSDTYLYSFERLNAYVVYLFIFFVGGVVKQTKL